MEKQEIIATLNRAYFSATPDEARVLAALPPLIAGVRSFADLGASLGQFTKFAADTLLNASILAVEADPLRFTQLRENCEAWATATRNVVRPLHAAVAAHPGEVQFEVTNSQVSGGLFRHSLEHLNPNVRSEVNWQAVRVPAVTLDSLYPDSPPDFVKMDIEGAELMALQGAARILAARRTMWLIELHSFAFTDGQPTSALVRRLMAQHGYHEVGFYDKSLFLQDAWRRMPLQAFYSAAKGILRRCKPRSKPC